MANIEQYKRDILQLQAEVGRLRDQLKTASEQMAALRSRYDDARLQQKSASEAFEALEKYRSKEAKKSRIQKAVRK